MTGSRTFECTPAVLATLAVLLAACSAGSASSDSSPAGDPDSSAPTEASSSGVFDADEPILPGGVRVLSQDVDGFVQVPAGRHAVRVSESLLYQFDLPGDSEVFGGVYVNPGRDAGGDTIVYLFPADGRMALPAHPCRRPGRPRVRSWWGSPRQVTGERRRPGCRAQTPSRLENSMNRCAGNGTNPQADTGLAGIRRLGVG